MIKIPKSRNFQVWEYKVSHGRLLIRSPSNAELGYKENIDLMFMSVEFFSLPRNLAGVQVVNPSQEEIDKFHYLTSEFPHKNIFVLNTDSGRYLVIASQMIIDINEMNIMASPFE